MRASSLFCTLAITCAAGAVCAPAVANSVLNGDFEQGTFIGGPGGSQQVLPGSTAISNWTVTGAPVTWYANGNNLQQIALTAHTGNLGLNLADETSNTVTIGETVNLLPFVEYQLSFWVGNYSANNSPVSVLAMIVDGTSNTIQLAEVTAPAINQGSSWQRFTLPFIPDGTSNTITFGEINGPSYIGLDDVTVTQVPTAGTWMLFASGLSMLGLLRWLRRSRRWKVRP